MMRSRWFGYGALSAWVLALAACGGGGSSGADPSPTKLAQLSQAAVAPAAVPASALLLKSAQGVPSDAPKPAGRLSQARASTQGQAPGIPTATASFDWAERTYPEFFPGSQTDRLLLPYVYRYYPSTDMYLAVNGELIYALGPVTGDQVVALGKLSDITCLVSPASCEEAAGPRHDGIHVRSEGVDPLWGREFWEKLASSRREQCEGEIAIALGIAHPFSLSGNLDDTSRKEEDVYYLPAEKKSARRTIGFAVVETSQCHMEVVKLTKWRMVHYEPQTIVQYEFNDDPKKGVYWVRRTQPALDEQIASILKDALLPGASVSPVLRVETYDGQACEVRDLSLGQMTVTQCSVETGVPFSEQVFLASKAVSQGTLVWDDHATLVEMNVSLSLTLFLPPVGATIVDQLACPSGRCSAGQSGFIACRPHQEDQEENLCCQN